MIRILLCIIATRILLTCYRTLTGEGALKCVKFPTEYCVPSPLIRALISSTLAKKGRISIPSYLPTYEGFLDVKDALMQALPLFDGSIMKKALQNAFKRNECAWSDVKEGGFVPHENCYKMELVKVLSQVSVL